MWMRSWALHITPGLILFLAEGMAEEQDDAPSHSTPMPEDSPWPPLSSGHQHHPTYTDGARPKVPTKPSTGQSQSQTSTKAKREVGSS